MWYVLLSLRLRVSHGTAYMASLICASCLRLRYWKTAWYWHGAVDSGIVLQLAEETCIQPQDKWVKQVTFEVEH
ncbi:hypothetical protein BKA61DRAFT_592769 [Leptodontidium sp. MPI-SDFR-AT-0119]|nr:hypothetical protein BKA61DRAFT_592769 [Leptodontidium sp. MPI-SDFR-AT-0119]